MSTIRNNINIISSELNCLINKILEDPKLIDELDKYLTNNKSEINKLDNKGFNILMIYIERMLDDNNFENFFDKFYNKKHLKKNFNKDNLKKIIEILKKNNLDFNYQNDDGDTAL